MQRPTTTKQLLVQLKGKPLKQLLRDTYAEAGNTRAAAAALGISQPTFDAWLRDEGLCVKTDHTGRRYIAEADDAAKVAAVGAAAA